MMRENRKNLKGFSCRRPLVASSHAPEHLSAPALFPSRRRSPRICRDSGRRREMEGLSHARRCSPFSASPARKKQPEMASSDSGRRGPVSRSLTLGGERTMKKLRLSKALTMPDSTTVLEACRRMAARRVNAALLTDSNALLCGILTDKDIAKRVVACELPLQDTPVSKVMTRNPIFVLSDTLAEEALQKMVLGKFRHLPVVENGEVIALLDIAKCLYDAISRVERAAEKGKAIQAAVEGVEKSWGSTASAPNTFLEALRDRVFQPSLSTIIPGNSKTLAVSPTESVLAATKKMVEYQTSSAVIIMGNKPVGILTSRDILMRLIAKNLPAESTAVEKVMTTNPDCRTIDTSILDALQTMRAGNFLHLPITDKGGNIISVVDVLHVTNAALTTFENPGSVGNEAAMSLIQKFWVSAMTIASSEEDDDSRSDGSTKMTFEGTDIGASPAPSSILPETFSFKLQDRKGRIHRFQCETRSLTFLITSILQRIGDDINGNYLLQIQYEDEDGDKVILASDSDLTAAVDHARLVGWKGLRLHLDYTSSGGRKKHRGSGRVELASMDAWTAAFNLVAAGAALVAGLGMITYLRRCA